MHSLKKNANVENEDNNKKKIAELDTKISRINAQISGLQTSNSDKDY